MAKFHKCPKCGEKIPVEAMRHHLSVCKGKPSQKGIIKIPLSEWHDFHSMIARMKPEEAIHYINAFIRKYPLYAKCIQEPTKCFVREENGVIVISVI